jgi:iron-sulfur cluster repair protein YtfE (RIC family)
MMAGVAAGPGGGPAVAGRGGPVPLLHAELSQIHDCLRAEVDKLLSLAAALDESSRAAAGLRAAALGELARQLDFFFVVYHSHSKAEDEVILPALSAKGLAPEADDELRAEHSRQSSAFDRARALLAALRDPAKPDAALAALRAQLHELVASIRASVWLHLKYEEEELFPLLLHGRLGEAELEQIAGGILGNRSSELVKDYLDMTLRDLPAEQRGQVLDAILLTARGTRFASWMGHAGTKRVPDAPAEEDKPGRALPAGAVKTYHQCLGSRDCCPPPAAAAATGAAPPLGCKHYRRNCKLYYACCGELFTCRLCHDETVTARCAAVLTPVTRWHQADRYAVRKMWCMLCGHLGPVGAHCRACRAQMARYFCDVCNLLDDAEARPIYHCPFCNVCRVAKGLGQDMFHCMRCNCCMSTRLKQHMCRDNSLETGCAICLELLSEATRPVQLLQCGHLLHRQCYQQYVATNFKCPTCRKCALDMSVVWQKYDEIWAGLRLQGPPLDVALRCDECGYARPTRVNRLPPSIGTLPYQCPACRSYNTSWT